MGVHAGRKTATEAAVTNGEGGSGGKEEYSPRGKLPLPYARRITVVWCGLGD